MSRVVFLHARSASIEESFYHKVGKDLQKHGLETVYLQVQNQQSIQSENWLAVLQEIQSDLDENCYLVAHSLAALVVCRFLTDNQIHLKGLHLVAGVFADTTAIEQIREIDKHIAEFSPESIDFAKINQSCWQIFIHHSQDDDRVDYQNALNYAKKLPKAKLLTYTDRGHFLSQTDFAELTEKILEQENKTFTHINGQKYKINVVQNLPLKLPLVEDFQPSADGRSPLGKIDWINLRNEQGEIIGQHESDTMPNWAGSSWYYLRFIDPKNSTAIGDPDKLQYWLPVDHYFGGNEHTTVHLLYSRFWHRFLYDQGHLPVAEPYNYRTNGGILLGPDGYKMSKSRGNVLNPQEKIDEYGVDALRLYIAFIGPYDATVVWQDGGLKACKRLVDTVFALSQKVSNSEKQEINSNLLTSYHKFVRNVTNQITEMRNNVAVAEIMTFVNILKEQTNIPLQIWSGFLQVLSPFAPHTSEELWYKLHNFDEKNPKHSIHLTSWPEFDPALCIDEKITFAVQINGKLRATFEIGKDASEEEIMQTATNSVSKWLEGKTIKFSKIIPSKMVTFAV